MHSEKYFSLLARWINNMKPVKPTKGFVYVNISIWLTEKFCYPYNTTATFIVENVRACTTHYNLKSWTLS